MAAAPVARGGQDSPTPCGPSGRCVAAVPAFPIFNSNPPKAKESVGQACAAALGGKALGTAMRRRTANSNSSAADGVGGRVSGCIPGTVIPPGSNSGDTSWPVNQQLQGALQKLLVILKEEDRFTSPVSTQRSLAGSDGSVRAWNALAAADGTRDLPFQPRTSCGKASGQGETVRTKDKVETDMKFDLGTLLRPLQAESPQVLSDFFRLLKKIGVAGVDKCTQALEEHPALLDSKRQLEERVMVLERRIHDLELLNLQYRALLQGHGHGHVPSRICSGDCPSSLSFGSEDSPRAGFISCASSNHAPSPSHSSQIVARGWSLQSAVTPSAASERSDLFASKDKFGSNLANSNHTSPFPAREPRGWIAPGPGRNRSLGGVALPSANLEPAAEEDGRTRPRPKAKAGDRNRALPKPSLGSRAQTPPDHFSGSSGSSSASGRSHSSGGVSASVAASGTASSDAVEGGALERKLFEALQTQDALHTENYYLQHLLRLSTDTPANVDRNVGDTSSEKAMGKSPANSPNAARDSVNTSLQNLPQHAVGFEMLTTPAQTGDQEAMGKSPANSPNAAHDSANASLQNLPQHAVGFEMLTTPAQMGDQEANSDRAQSQHKLINNTETPPVLPNSPGTATPGTTDSRDTNANSDGAHSQHKLINKMETPPVMPNSPGTATPGTTDSREATIEGDQSKTEPANIIEEVGDNVIDLR